MEAPFVVVNGIEHTPSGYILRIFTVAGGAGEKSERHETVRRFRQKIGDMDEVALRRLDERRDFRARRRRDCGCERGPRLAVLGGRHAASSSSYSCMQPREQK